ncbi:hypothetical protein MVEN_02402300 [Mycena venus]|uniref:Uncharacterized protein n=1 Tax=Mycena venus TaxID=2733690 RepID=A0A8H7CCW8_9AGAR|nr:hypothetical protein MVEN_02402300 [Mycena venus]
MYGNQNTYQNFQAAFYTRVSVAPPFEAEAFVRGVREGFQRYEGQADMYENAKVQGIFNSRSTRVPLVVDREGYNRLHLFSSHHFGHQKVAIGFRTVRVDDPAMLGREVYCVYRCRRARGAGPQVVDSLEELFQWAQL